MLFILPSILCGLTGGIIAAYIPLGADDDKIRSSLALRRSMPFIEMIPQLFEQLLRDWSIDPTQTPRLHYYLQRHIEIDRDEHGPAANS